jgi:hypothetical protein
LQKLKGNNKQKKNRTGKNQVKIEIKKALKNNPKALNPLMLQCCTARA